MKMCKLREGGMIPQIGVGTWNLKDTDVIKKLLERAARQELCLIDTASAYTNEIAISKALRRISVPREKFFIQDKLWNTNRGYIEAQEACKRSLKKLKVDYLDSYLIHWPASPRLHKNWAEINAETWRGLEQLKKEGVVNHIGVCNFKQYHLEQLKSMATEVPEINQIEFHPGCYPKKLLHYCEKNDILIEASSPLGNGAILENPVLVSIAYKYKKSSAQICLRWEIEKGIVVIPKTSRPDRQASNSDVFEFSLTQDEKIMIDNMEYCGGLALDSDEVTEFG